MTHDIIRWFFAFWLSLTLPKTTYVDFEHVWNHPTTLNHPRPYLWPPYDPTLTVTHNLRSYKSVITTANVKHSSGTSVDFNGIIVVGFLRQCKHLTHDLVRQLSDNFKTTLRQPYDRMMPWACELDLNCPKPISKLTFVRCDSTIRQAHTYNLTILQSLCYCNCQLCNVKILYKLYML